MNETMPDLPDPETDPAKDRDARMWAMFCHLSGLAIVVSIPLANIIAPLVIWLIKKDEMPLVDRHGKESLNFQITVSIALVCCVPLIFVVIGIVLIPLVLIGDLVCVTMASVKANNGEFFDYPLTIRFLK